MFYILLIMVVTSLLACEKSASNVRLVDVMADVLQEDGLFDAGDAPVSDSMDAVTSDRSTGLDAPSDAGASSDGLDVVADVSDGAPDLAVDAEPPTDPPIYSEVDIQARRVFALGDNTYVTARDGSFWAWGFNGDGRMQPARSLPLVSDDYRVRPQQIPHVQDVREIQACLLAGPEGHGSIYCWGRGAWVRFARGGDTWEMWRHPHRLGAFNDVLTLGTPTGCVRAGNTYWEYRREGEEWLTFSLHDGMTLRVVSPGVYWLPGGVEAIMGLNDRFESGLHRMEVVALEGRPDTACMLLASGRVSCWGSNTFGQAGNFELGGLCMPPSALDHDCVRTPTEVPGLTDVAQISVSGTSACARRRDGTVWCWGGNDPLDDGLGTIGDGRAPDETCGIGIHGDAVFCRRRPVQVRGIANAIDISAQGNEHACAVLATGETVCWGRNNYGQLGDGTTRDHGLPAPVRWH